MKRRTTINPRTIATAKTPKSATVKCEGSIVGKNKKPGLAPSGKRCGCRSLCYHLPSRNAFRFIPVLFWSNKHAHWWFYFWRFSHPHLTTNNGLISQPISYFRHILGITTVEHDSMVLACCAAEANFPVTSRVSDSLYRQVTVLSLTFKIHPIFLLVSSNQSQSKAGLFFFSKN